MSKKAIDIIRSLELTIETRCAYCGKTFERYASHEWAYRGHGGRGAVQEGIYFCTYKCMRAAEQGKPKPRTRGTGYDWYELKREKKE